MSKKRKKLPIDYMTEENPTASAHECTGLTPRGVKTEEEAKSYRELYGVNIPDSELSGELTDKDNIEGSGSN